MATPQSAHVRQFIEAQLSKLGASSDVPSHEALLIHNGIYCGQRFKRDGFQAVWFVEEDQIKFHARDGIVISVAKPSEIAPSVQKAAA